MTALRSVANLGAHGFDDLLAPLHEAEVEVEVQVLPDPVHGTVARVLLTATAGANRAAIERKVKELFAPFVMRHRVEWK